MMNQITQLRLPNGQQVAFVDWTQRPLFSTCDVGTGFTNQSVSLFQSANGRPVPTVAPGGIGAITPRTNTLEDTNISTQGGAASTEEFLIYSIRPDVKLYTRTDNNFTTRTYLGANAMPFGPAATRGALNVLNAQCLIQLKVSQKVYSQAKFGWFNTGFGAAAFASSIPANPAAAAITHATNGFPSNSAVYPLNIPQHIGGQEKYQVQILNPNGDAVNFAITEAAAPAAGDQSVMASITVYLEGLYKRPVS
jgi:hypothetical protein